MLCGVCVLVVGSVLGKRPGEVGNEVGKDSTLRLPAEALG